MVGRDVSVSLTLHFSDLCLCMLCVKPGNPYSEVSCGFGDDRGEWSKGGGFVLVSVCWFLF